MSVRIFVNNNFYILELIFYYLLCNDAAKTQSYVHQPLRKIHDILTELCVMGKIGIQHFKKLITQSIV